MSLVYPTDHWIHIWSWVNLAGLVVALAIAIWIVIDSRMHSRTSDTARIAIASCLIFALPFTFARLVPGFALTLDEAWFLDVAVYLPFAGYALAILAVITQLRSSTKYICIQCDEPIEPTWDNCPNCGAALREAHRSKPVSIPANDRDSREIEPELSDDEGMSQASRGYQGNAYLKPIRGPGPIPTCKLESTTKIGRSQDRNHYALEHDELVSREHLSIMFIESGFVATDLGSANGTRVNGAAITKHHLSNGDEVQIGETVFRFIWTPDSS